MKVRRNLILLYAAFIQLAASCKDDESYRFGPYFWRRGNIWTTRKCSWITRNSKRIERRRRWCKFKQVKIACLRSCLICQDSGSGQATQSSLEPSTYPSMNTSIVPSSKIVYSGAPQSFPTTMSSHSNVTTSIPSSVPFAVPSQIQLNTSPTWRISDSPSTIQNACQIEQFAGDTITIKKLIGHGCWKAQVFTGGIFARDSIDFNCSSTDFVSANEDVRSYGQFEYGIGNKAFFSEGKFGWHGHFEFVSSEVVDETQVVRKVWDTDLKTYAIRLVLPVCP